MALMPLIKKLIFALPFLLSLMGVYQYLETFLKDVYLIFGFNGIILSQLVIFLALFLLTALFFVIFATLAGDWKLVLPVAVLGSLPALLALPLPSGLVVSLGFLAAFSLVYLSLHKKLADYLAFQPANLLIPSIKQICVLMLLVSSLAFYLSADAKIKTEGFQVPDSIIDLSLKMVMPDQLQSDQKEGQTSQASLPQISPEQIELLKQNPALLKQYGLDPGMLDELSKPQVSQDSKPQSIEQTFIKNEVKRQLQSIIAPQINLIPQILAALFFFTLQFGLTILSLTLFPLVLLIFTALEKTGFTMYSKEMREVKKLVV